MRDTAARLHLGYHLRSANEALDDMTGSCFSQTNGDDDDDDDDDDEVPDKEDMVELTKKEDVIEDAVALFIQPPTATTVTTTGRCPLPLKAHNTLVEMSKYVSSNNYLS